MAVSACRFLARLQDHFNMLEGPVFGLCAKMNVRRVLAAGEEGERGKERGREKEREGEREGERKRERERERVCVCVNLRSALVSLPLGASFFDPILRNVILPMPSATVSTLSVHGQHTVSALSAHGVVNRRQAVNVTDSNSNSNSNGNSDSDSDSDSDSTSSSRPPPNVHLEGDGCDGELVHDGELVLLLPERGLLDRALGGQRVDRVLQEPIPSSTMHERASPNLAPLTQCRSSARLAWRDPLKLNNTYAAVTSISRCLPPHTPP